VRTVAVIQQDPGSSVAGGAGVFPEASESRPVLGTSFSARPDTWPYSHPGPSRCTKLDDTPPEDRQLAVSRQRGDPLGAVRKEL